MKRERADRLMPRCEGRRFGLVAARFYEAIARDLIGAARNALRDCGVDEADVEVHEVPGCFELPFACSRLFASGRFSGLVALGAVIRGATPHFDYVAGECARGIMQVQLAAGRPIGFGVLTTDTLEQAEERADPQRGNKGYEAALAAATLVAFDAPAQVVPG